MAQDARWFRRNVDMMDSEWLAALPWASRAVWGEILAYVASQAVHGRCRAPIVKRFAGGRDIPVECVEECIAAAVADGALLIEDGDWIIANWARYQGGAKSNAERQKEHRERQRVTEDVTESVTRNEEVTETVTGRNENPLARTRQDRTGQDITGQSTGQDRGVGETKLRSILMEVPAFAKSPPAAGKLDELVEDFAELGDAAILRHAKAARDWALEPKTRYARSPDKPADGVKFLRNWLEKEIRSGRNGAT
jgi:hypothetical protein